MMENVSVNKRVAWMDALRGLAMFLVILHHSNVLPDSNIFQIWMCAFRMPLFFVLAGYTFSPDRYRTYKEFLVKKIRTLLVPYAIYQILNIAFGYFRLFLWGVNNTSKLVEELWGFVVQIRLEDSIAWDGGLWFLTCLFIMENLMYFLTKTTGKNQKIETGG